MCHKHSYTTNDPKPRRPRPCASPFPNAGHPPRQYSPSHHALDFSNSAHTRPHIALHLQHTMYQNAQSPSATTTPSSTPACRTSKFRIFSADSHTRQSRAFMIRFVECIFSSTLVTLSRTQTGGKSATPGIQEFDKPDHESARLTSM